MKLNRTINTEAKRSADNSGLIEMSISSEAPYERWFGFEILSHDPSAVDMTRIADGRHPVLLNHSTDQQIGVFKKAWLDETDRMVRGGVKFSRSQLGQEIMQDVEDEIRTLTSVGYMIEEIVEIEPAMDGDEVGDDSYMIASLGAARYKAVRRLSGDEFETEMKKKYGDLWHRSGPSAKRDANEDPDMFLVTRWIPFEGSIVPVPADVNVGVNRSAGVENDSAIVGAGHAREIAPAKPAAAPAAAPVIIQVKGNTMPENQKSPAELEIDRRDGIMAIAGQYGQWLTEKETREAIQNPKMSIDAFKDFIIGKMSSKHSDTSALAIGMTSKEVKRYSFGRMLVAKITGDYRNAGLEVECSRAIESIMGRAPEGFYVPFEYMKRDFNVGTSSEAGNLVATDLRSDLYVDALRNAMVMGKLGVRFLAGLTGNVDLPRKSTAGTLGMLTEIGSASETNPVTAKATLSPKRIGAYVQVSKQALIQSAMSLENMLRDDLVTGAAVLLESQVISGAGTGAEIKGLANVTGIGTTTAGTNGALPTWGNIVDLESACANANAEPDSVAGYLFNTKTRGRLKQTQLGTNLPMIWQNSEQPINGYRVAVSNNVRSNLTKGTSTTICSEAFFGSDWSMVTIGLFGAPDIVVDPYSLAATGQVQITLNQFADMQHRQPACTARIPDLLTS